MVRESDWFKCYSESWTNEIVPEAFSHPAKFARGLIRRIYAHALEQGYLKEGAVVIDPFGGVALGGLDAMFHGLNFVAVELEEKFVSLGQQNIDLWNRRYGNGKMPRWGTAVILQGDSRRLCEVLEGARAEGIISSPPYDETLSTFAHISEEFWEENKRRWGRPAGKQGRKTDKYSTDDRNLGNMPTGEPPQCILSSPPYADAVNPHGEGPGMTGNEARRKRIEAGAATERAAQSRKVGYGKSDGQLGQMKEGEPPQAVIASPPYAGSISGDEATHPEFRDDGDTFRPGQSLGKVYGKSDGQLAAMREGEPPQVDGLIASPPYARSMSSGKGGIDESKYQEPKKRIAKHHQANIEQCYSTNPDNLGNMKEGEPPMGIISSPPFADSQQSTDADFVLDSTKVNPTPRKLADRSYFPAEMESDGQLAAMREGDVDAVIASPPHIDSLGNGKSGIDWSKQTDRDTSHPHGWDGEGYGESDGQLAALPEGEPPQAIISSPPYSDSLKGNIKTVDTSRLKRIKDAGHDKCGLLGSKHSQTISGNYSIDPDNLGNMKEGEPQAGIVQVDACVSSPPYWDSLERHGEKPEDVRARMQRKGWSQESIRKVTDHSNDTQSGYGVTEGQLAAKTQPNTFWSAAKTILDQCHAVLAPGGVAIWVVKDFIRAKKRIDFTGQWRALCESCGFETIEVIRAWLVEERGTQYDLMGESHTRQVERKSFFRRLYEFKARAAKFWESVSRGDKASYLWCAHGELWRDYHRRVLEDESPPPLPTRTRILYAAQASAYREAGEPDVEIDTQIDYEIVLITQKPS